MPRLPPVTRATREERSAIPDMINSPGMKPIRVAAIALAAALCAPAAVHNLPLWDAGKVPLANGDGPLDAPFLTVFLPAAGKGNGASVVIAPGGSNIMLMYGGGGVGGGGGLNHRGGAAGVFTPSPSPKYKQDARGAGRESA